MPESLLEERLPLRHEVCPGVTVGDDLRDRQQARRAAGVVVVLVGVEDVADRLGSDAPDLREQGVMIAVVHVVDEHHPFTRHVRRDVAALARDHVQVALHPFAAEPGRRWRSLGEHGPGGVHHEEPGEGGGEGSASHTRDYTAVV